MSRLKTLTTLNLDFIQKRFWCCALLLIKTAAPENLQLSLEYRKPCVPQDKADKCKQSKTNLFNIE